MLKVNFSFRINKPIDLVFDYLTDMQKFASVHPVISKIKPTGGCGYLVYETLKLGFIPVSFTYPVTIEQNPDTWQLKITATVMKMTKITMNFSLQADNNRTTISEEIIFKSPLPIQSAMTRIFQQQHTRLFKNIEDLK